MTAEGTKSGQTLYQRLGGYDVIASIIDDLLSRMRNDPKMQRFGAGRGTDSLARARQLLVDQICALTGGPCVYIGRDMKTSHAGLHITESEWDTNLQYTLQALDKHRIPAKEKAEFIALFERYRADIVGV
jgi:hemoglobin